MSLELDHVFVAASFEAPEMRLLREAGFIAGPVHDHPGQGTASRGVFFENAYLELIWLTDPALADGPPIRRTNLARRAHPQDEASPFGFGLRSARDPVPSPPFETWAYAPPYLPEGVSFAMAENSERLDEPLIFILPWSRTPSWEVPAHPNGAGRLSSVALGSHASSPSPAMSAFLDLGLVAQVDAATPRLEIHLDDGRQAQKLDLRPSLPLVIHW